jgi:hypothetical protein
MHERPVAAGDSFQPGKLSGSSGLAKAFPALDDPSYLPASADLQSRPDDEIVGVFHRGHARALPTWVARHYHIVNDRWQDGERLLIDT